MIIGNIKDLNYDLPEEIKEDKKYIDIFADCMERLNSIKSFDVLIERNNLKNPQYFLSVIYGYLLYMEDTYNKVKKFFNLTSEEKKKILKAEIEFVELFNDNTKSKDEIMLKFQDVFKSMLIIRKSQIDSIPSV